MLTLGYALGSDSDNIETRGSTLGILNVYPGILKNSYWKPWQRSTATAPLGSEAPPMTTPREAEGASGGGSSQNASAPHVEWRRKPG